MTTRDVPDEGLDVLVIRVWRDPDAEQPLRARITYGDDQTAVGPPTTDPEEIVAAVRRWLDERSSGHRA